MREMVRDMNVDEKAQTVFSGFTKLARARHKHSSYQHVMLILLAWAVAVCGVVTVVIL